MVSFGVLLIIRVYCFLKRQKKIYPTGSSHFFLENNIYIKSGEHYKEP